MSVDKVLARDRELREHATERPWHQSGHGTRLRLLGPLPRAPIVVDPYAPNPQDAPLILHRVNTYEDLEEEIARLRETLRDTRSRLEAGVGTPAPETNEHAFEQLLKDLEGRISAVLGDRRAAALLPSAQEGRLR